MSKKTEGWQRNYVVLLSGEQIRYTLWQRPGTSVYLVNFTKGDKRLERTTGQIKKPDAVREANRIIKKEFGEIEEEVVRNAGDDWESVKEKLQSSMRADGKREKTIKGYVETLDKLIAVFPDIKGPAYVTADIAEEFKSKYSSGTFSRKRNLAVGEEAPEYARKAKSQDSRLRTLKAVFGWFVSLRLADGNPFENVATPKLDRHEVKYVKQEDVTDFFAWLEERFPGWEMPQLFFKAKALSGCRLEDICTIRSDSLRDGGITFLAGTTKNRSERHAILPKELYASLEAYKGDTFLWERYPPELIEVNRKKGYPTHRQNPGFDPSRLYNWVVQIMGDYQKQTGKDLSSHDFRRAAFTRVAEEDVHPKRAAVAFDVTAETMFKYYTAADKRKTADEVLGSLADKLLPKKKE